jgi:hypothetical protein
MASTAPLTGLKGKHTTVRNPGNVTELGFFDSISRGTPNYSSQAPATPEPQPC